MGIIITEFEWDEGNIGHMLARHNVIPDEVEEAAFDGPTVWERGGNGRYYLLSQTLAGRYLFIVIEYHGQGRARAITARDMTPTERRRWNRRRG